MDDRIRKHIVAYLKRAGDGVGDGDIREALIEAGYDPIWRGNRDEHRWFDWYDFAVKIDGMLLMYNWCVGKSESGTAADAGEVLDLDTVREAEPKQVTVTIYEPV